ncbi:MAG: 23S rRNA (uracil(1939)-C(5))-methyltransferase RlmD [Sarcina sp.]
MVEKNKEYILDIVDQGYEGEGIGKIDGTFPIFVEGALKGEKVKVLIIKAKKKFAYGKLIEVIEESSERRKPECKIYKKCGGCTLQHSSYKGQLDFKWDRVKDCMKKIGKLNPEIVKYPLGMESPYRYRNKVQLPVGSVNGKLHIGFFESRSHNIVDMNSCLIQDEVADKVVELTREWMTKYKIKPYIKDGQYDEKGIVRHIMIRRGFTTNEIMVVIVTNGEKLPYGEEFVDLMLDNIRGLASVIQNVNSEKTNVILGRKNINLWGDDTISDYIGKYKFNISPQSFFQVNPVQTEVLYGKALEFAELTGEETVFDAYCGTGTITLFLSEKAKKVYGVEIVEGAIKNAKINAKENKIENAEFILGQSEIEIPKLIEKGIKADVVVVDPPRKGCEKALLDSITTINAKRIVYVSCDPSTLARDLEILETQGYKTIEVQPVDMFPHTSHIENVAVLIKGNS